MILQNKQKVFAMLLVLVITIQTLGISITEVSAASTVTYTNAAEICSYVYQGYNDGVYGPVTITKGVLAAGSTKKDVYLVTLSGTENVENQTTGYLTDLLSGFDLDNKYYSNCVSIISKNIPTDANIIFAGHSLGGMVCQQLAANTTLKNNYNILNTVCFGSPLLSAGSREGTVKRLGDTSDIVPYLSGSLFNNTAWAIFGLNRENGGYGTDYSTAHVKSYIRSDVWGKYDVTGTKYGSATLTLDLSTLTYYQSPVWG